MKKLRERKHDLEFVKREFDSEVLQGVKGMISYFSVRNCSLFSRVLMHP